MGDTTQETSKAENVGLRGPGPPRKFTPERCKALVQIVRMGMSLSQACQMTDITLQTLWNWRKRAEQEGQGPYYELFEEMKRAEAEGLAASLQQIIKAAQGGQVTTETRVVEDSKGNRTTTTTTKEHLPEWTAAAWLTERRDPQNWGRKQAVQVNVNWQKTLEDQGYDVAILEEQVVDHILPMLEASLKDGGDDGTKGDTMNPIEET